MKSRHSDVTLSFSFQALGLFFNYIIKDSPNTSSQHTQKTNVVYQFTCPLPGCKAEDNIDNKNSYIGMTVTSLSKRLTTHITGCSSIKDHLSAHSIPGDQIRQILVDHTRMLIRNTFRRRLPLLEALKIKELTPTLNRINFKVGQNVLAIF